jgi:hypothetical protein
MEDNNENIDEEQGGTNEVRAITPADSNLKYFSNQIKLKPPLIHKLPTLTQRSDSR